MAAIAHRSGQTKEDADGCQSQEHSMDKNTLAAGTHESATGNYKNSLRHENDVLRKKFSVKHEATQKIINIRSS